MPENLSLPTTYRPDRWYSGPRLWKKLSQIAKLAGEKALLTSLTLFYCLKDSDTPKWAKGVIVGALGYLILPADAIPDILPGIGYSDDWGALVAALGTVAAYVKDEHKLKASQQAHRLFGSPKPPVPEEFSE
ncbi:MAG: YkvA family protein [Luteolibacter sp.]